MLDHFTPRPGHVLKKVSEARSSSAQRPMWFLTPPNGFGFYDMTGNVWEWTARNPSKQRPYGLRGGSWINVNGDYLRVAVRFPTHPDYHYDIYGFRVAAAPQERLSEISTDDADYCLGTMVDLF